MKEMSARPFGRSGDLRASERRAQFSIQSKGPSKVPGLRFTMLVAEARTHPNLLVLPFSLELIRAA